jgi:hypothetical protein
VTSNYLIALAVLAGLADGCVKNELSRNAAEKQIAANDLARNLQGVLGFTSDGLAATAKGAEDELKQLEPVEENADLTNARRPAQERLREEDEQRRKTDDEKRIAAERLVGSSRVALFEEDPSEPQGKEYVGQAVWRTENVTILNGTDIAIRADINVPKHNLNATLTVRRNTDTSLPASHMVELIFQLPLDFAGRGISSVPGVIMKQNGQTRGTPLRGLATKVTDTSFVVGLSNVDADRIRNLTLLKGRPLFDIPVVYADQRRAILAIYKDATGERAFAEAFAAWQQ